MSNELTPPVSPTPNTSSRWLWAAVGALGAATLAMGVALVQMRSAPVAPAAQPEAVVAVSYTHLTLPTSDLV